MAQIKETITIIGAGLAGALLAVLLRQRGYPVDVYERRPDLRGADIPGGRSINLALAERGLHGLRIAGLAPAVMAEAVMMRGRMVHDRDGRQTLQPYGVCDDEVIWSVHRGQLNRTLLNAAEAAGARLHFNVRLTAADVDQGLLYFIDENNHSEYQAHAKRIIGTDGAGSALRTAMNQARDLGESFTPLGHGYKEIHVAPAADGSWRFEPNALHIWPRGGYMMIALPNIDRSFTCTLFLPNTSDDAATPAFDHLLDNEVVRAFFERDFTDLIPHAPDFFEQFRDNPTGLLGTLHLERWSHADRALLMGDAAHAIVPFHGQGMNCAFEDCVALVDALDDTSDTPDWQALFEGFQNARKPNSDAIAQMALENYIEMRDAVANPSYLLRRALEQELSRRYPGQFLPRYTMVMFTRLPYTEALVRGALQRKILDDALTGLERIEQVDMDALQQRLGMTQPI